MSTTAAASWWADPTGHLTQLLLAPTLKTLGVLFGALVVNRIIRWVIRRVVHSLQRQGVQDRLDLIRSRTPKALLATTEPMPGLRRAQRIATIGAIVRNVASVLIWVVALLVLLHLFGIQLGPLIAGAGLAGVAISLSAQQMVRDVLSGIAMLVEDQYGPGDVINVGHAKGTVERVGLRSTQLRSADGTVWHVRNGEVSRLGNDSRGWNRALVDLEVGRGQDVGHALRVLEVVARELGEDEHWRSVLMDKPEVWGVEDIGPGGITMRLVVKTLPARQFDILRELRGRLQVALHAAGIDLPTSGSTLVVSTVGPPTPTSATTPAPKPAKKAAKPAAKRATKAVKRPT